MKKEKAMQLVKALRSGEYVQGLERLRSEDDKFCCLGVACDISESELGWHPGGRCYVIGSDIINGSAYLPKEIKAEFDFYQRTGGRRDHRPILINGKEFASLAVANDLGCTFEQIADYIEENYKQL